MQINVSGEFRLGGAGCRIMRSATFHPQPPLHSTTHRRFRILNPLTRNGANFLDVERFRFAATTPAARTTLGLGTIATQAANNVSITGGTIDGVTIDGGTY